MTGKLTDKEKEYLLSLARRSIAHFLKNGMMLTVMPDEVPTERLVEDGACFVTLKTGENLRGCIGSLEAHRPLFMDCVENAVAAAFQDPRFRPLEPPELPSIRISISFLTKPEPFPVKGPEDLLARLIPGKHGLIMRKGMARATFLPAVWEQLPEKQQFLSQLSLKAGMGPDGWKEKGVEFQVYEADEFSE